LSQSASYKINWRNILMKFRRSLIKSALSLFTNLECLVLFAMSLAYVTIVSILAVMAHYSFYTNAWDLGIYAQALYSTFSHGKLLYYSVEAAGNPSRSLFGIHFTPFLLLLVPIYALYQNPIILLILRPVAISLGLIPLYWIIREGGVINKRLTILLAATYLIYPPMLIPIPNFDILCFLPALFLFTMYYLRGERYVRSYIFMLLALMVNEFVSLIAMATAIYVLLAGWRENLSAFREGKINKKIAFSILLFLTGILWFNLACSVITYFNPAALGTKWEWGELGSSPTQIIINVLTNPVKVLNALLNDGQRKFLYIISLFGPLAFMSLLEPLSLLMALPWLAASLLSINPLYYSIESQYPAFTSPFIFISAIDGVKKLANFSTDIAKKVAIMMAIMLFTSILLVPFGTFSEMVRFDERDSAIWLALKEIPPEASVSVMPDIYPHLCNRIEAYPYFVDGVEYVLINIYSWWYDVILPRPTHIAPRWCDVSVGDEYGIVLNMNGVLLYKRGYNGPIKYFSGVSFRYGVHDLVDSSGKIILDEDGSRVVDALIHIAGEQSSLLFRTAFKYLPPGDYRVVVRLKVSYTTPKETIRFEVRTRPGEVKIFTKEFSVSELPLAEWRDLSFYFSINKPMPIEFASYVGNSSVYFQSLNVLQVREKL